MKKCCAKKRCAIVEFTLFWRELRYDANYVFCVLIFGPKIFICGILYAFSISVQADVHQGRRSQITLFGSESDVKLLALK